MQKQYTDLRLAIEGVGKDVTLQVASLPTSLNDLSQAHERKMYSDSEDRQHRMPVESLQLQAQLDDLRQSMGEAQLEADASEQHTDIAGRLSNLETCLRDLSDVHDLDARFASFCESVAQFQAEVRTAVQQHPGCALEAGDFETTIDRHGVVVADGEQAMEEQQQSVGLEQLVREVKQARASAAHRATLDEYRAEALDAVDLRVSAVAERLSDTCERLSDAERSLEKTSRGGCVLRMRFDRLESGIESRVDVLAEHLSEVTERQLEIERGLLAAAQGSLSVGHHFAIRSRMDLQSPLTKVPTASSRLRSSHRADPPAFALPPPPLALPITEPSLVVSPPMASSIGGGGTSDGRMPQTS